MTDWPTFWDRPPMDRRTALTVRGAHIFGHLTGSGPVLGKPVVLHQFLTRGHRKTASGVHVPTGVLTAGGCPAAEVTVWIDKFGIACSGRLLNPGAITASARINGADPWPRWQILADAAHLVSVELDTSQRPSPTLIELTAPERQAAALERITAIRQERAMQRIQRARR